MMQKGLSRRDFLRLSGTAAAAALAGMAAPSRVRAQSAAAGIVLSGGAADVWNWETTVSGRVTDLACDMVKISAKEAEVEAAVAEGNFSATVPISEGENVIRAICQNDGEQAVTSEPLTYTGRLRDVPRSVISITLDGDQIVLDGSGSQPSEKSGSPITTFAWSVRPDNPGSNTGQDIHKMILDSEHVILEQRIVLTTPPEDGEYYIWLLVKDEAGRSDKSTTYFRVKEGKVVLDDWDTENVDWIENTVVYGVIPRNFGSAGFDSITERLDSLKDLGINALWLAPVNVSPPGDYGYAVVDYFEFDRRYGDKEEFRRMVQEAHKRGIRVLMDFVPNHSSERHPYFLDAVNRGTESPYWDFYARDEEGMFTHYFDWTHLPNLNYDNPDVRRWQMEAMTYWVREFDIDGYRVDVAWGIRERYPEFWMEWRHELKRIKPDVLLLAEASARDEFYFTGGFDAAYDWTNQLGHWAWGTAWEDPNLMLFNLDSAITYRRTGYHPDALIFRFLNNNDTGFRFVTKFGIDLTRVATALLLTLPGIPCVYTGDEYGEAFSPYSDPGALAWKEQYEGLRDYHKTLIHLRRETPSLHSRFMTVINLEPHTRVYGYMRHLEDGSAPLLVLLNFFGEAADLKIRLPEEFADFAAESYRDVLNGETITTTVGETVDFPMQAWSVLILEPVS